MKFDYNEMIPDELVDTFYQRVQRCIDENRSYEREVGRLISLNGKVPEKIQKLIDGKTDEDNSPR